MSRNGETFLQRSVIANGPADTPLVIFDIGANQAEWTAALLKSVPDDRCRPSLLQIHAFEPIAATAQIFERATREHGAAECIRLNRFALSNSPGEMEIAVFHEGGGTNSLHFSRDERSPERTETISLKTLDQYCAEERIDHIHLVKCDTEGHDSYVIEGAAQALKAGTIDLFQFEYNHRWVFSRKFLLDIFEMIEGTDYSLGRVDPTHITLFDNWHFELERFFWSNYILIHKRALNWIPVVRGQFDKSNVYR